MKLVSRVSAFFLAALGLSLVGNAVLLWGLVKHFLYQRFDQQLHAALHTLVAAVEVEDDDAKWEPSDHTIALGAEDGLDDVRWVVFDDAGRLVDHSRNLSPKEADDAQLIASAQAGSVASQAHGLADGWRLIEQSLSAPHPKPQEERDAKEFAGLRVVVLRTPAEIQASLRQLAMLVISVSAGVWLAAAVLGSWYCRKALQPVREMAQRARDVTDADFRTRLCAGPHEDELTDLSRAFNGLLDQLQQAFEKQRRFSGDAAHQLRTPLTVLLGQIDVSLRRPRTAEEYHKTLVLLHTQTRELQQIVETLLFLARIEGDAVLPGVESRDGGEWLSEYVGRWDGHPRKSDLSVMVSESLGLSTSLPLLAQLLDNLVGNAFKYSEAGTPVTVSLSRDSGAVVLAVEDRGMGIPPEDRSAIFDPFFRSRVARQSNVAGTGLGLAIAAGIARALGGQLACESESGRGSRFYLVLSAACDA